MYCYVHMLRIVGEGGGGASGMYNKVAVMTAAI